MQRLHQKPREPFTIGAQPGSFLGFIVLKIALFGKVGEGCAV